MEQANGCGMGVAMGTIDLAVEPDFRLGPWLVRPSLGMACRDGAEVKLEPRVLLTLIVLVRAEGHPVSRTELMRTAWGLEVGDDAIGRCIGRLRAVLAVDGVIGFETIPKIGYRLTVATGGAASPAVEAHGPAPVPMRRRLSVRLWPGMALIVLLLAGGLLLLGGDQDTPPRVQVTPVTSDPGQEIQPALSPGGGQIAYAADRAGQGFDIWVQSLSGGTPVRLTDDPAPDLSPAWSPDGGRIAFVRLDPAGPCRILVQPVPSGPERQVAACTTFQEVKPAWRDNDHLVYADKADKTAPARLWSVALSGVEAGQPVPLTEPPADINSDGDPALSPDGNRLAFIRHRAIGVSDVIVRDLATGLERQVTQDGRKMHGLEWSGDGRWLYTTSSRAGDFGLWRVDPDGEAPQMRIAPGLNQLGRIGTGGDRVAVEMWTNRSTLLRLGPDGQQQAVVPPSNRLDWDPDVSRQGAVAFASDRSGMFEIWVADPGQAPTPVTQFQGPFTQSPRWAPDGKRLALISVVEGAPGLFILDRGSGRLRRVAADPGSEDRAPAWSRDGQRLYFASNRLGAWRIWITRPPYDQAMPITEAGWRVAKESADGRWLYLVRDGESGLWRQPADGGLPEKLADLPDASDDESWVVGPDGVYLIERPGDGQARILLLPADGGEMRRVGDLPDALYNSSLALDPDGRLIIGRYLGSLVDIVNVRLGD
ncbi:MAG: winged helix-turn-helix domain-containing protein [Niveispirillum sp.]|uniref:winged helix-turn-helix domain-containing protein n=1 Tax=Niveispirillum sp. TaxID=1917217 RepID=UPI003BA42978